MAVDKLIADITAHTESRAAALMLRGLTLDGRIEETSARAGLSPAECYACDCIVAQDLSIEPAAGNFSLAFRPHGRLYFVPREEFEADASALRLLCHVALDADDLATYRTLRRSTEEMLEQERGEICADLTEQGFDRVCADLAFAAEHMAPLIYYIGDQCISNFYEVGKSGFPREMTLTHALEQVEGQRAHAKIEALTAVYCLHLALGSGGYTRLEELNGTQLSRSALIRFFDAVHGSYEPICPSPAKEDFASLSVRARSAALARMREAIARGQRFIRLINGTNLRKREAILAMAPAGPCDVSAPSEEILAILQRCMPPGSSIEALLRPRHLDGLLGSAVVPAERRASYNSLLEYLIDCVVAEAVRSTDSDIGMTRSTRDYRQFVHALRDRQTVIACSWSQAEYFCHVVPSPSMRASLPPRTIGMILNAISARMRFNSWHYAPSYFSAKDIPDDRGWFTAPRMADIADESDQHHRGHIQAMVRYSIRSPLPLRVGDEVLPGFIDLRLMRQKGEPYRSEHLVTAIAYTEALQFLYQRLMAEVVEHDVAFAFSFGDKKWFDRMYQAPPEERPRAAALAQAPAAQRQVPVEGSVLPM